MQVIAVLDLWAGKAVHASGGDRRRYRPVKSALAPGSDPVSLARAFRDHLGIQTCYLADLGAIAGGPTDLRIVRTIADQGLKLWVDAAIRDAATAGRVLAAGASRAVIGLETLPDPSALASVGAALPSERLAFSLDLRAGRPVAAAPVLAGETPLQLAGRAFEAGYRTLILLDLARVGSMGGPYDELLPPLRARYPQMSVVIGGGVRDRDDLRRLADLGCAAVLVGTALHAGRITRADIRTVEAV